MIFHCNYILQEIKLSRCKDSNLHQTFNFPSFPQKTNSFEINFDLAINYIQWSKYFMVYRP